MSIRCISGQPSIFAAAVILVLLTPAAHAQRAFPTPEEAAGALAAAVKSGVQKDILSVLGPGGDDIISSGDEVADAEARQRFTAAWDARHSIKLEARSSSAMTIFPFRFR